MKVIKLHNVDDGEPIYLMVSNIVAWEPNSECTRVYTKNITFTVREEPQEVVRLILHPGLP